MTWLGVLLATAGGIGRVPVAPGTAGSAVGLVVYLLTMQWPAAWQIALVAGIALIGTWASGIAAARLGDKDPGPVVIDEVAGQLLTLLLVPVSLAGAIVGFFVFRVFDIIKPWPANRLEELPGGAGVMADDLMAAVYGNIVLRIAVYALPGYL